MNAPHFVKFTALLTDFVNLHIDDFLESKSYEKKYGDTVITSYIPEYHNKNEPSYIVNKPYYKDFVNSFITDVIYSETLIFNTLNHLDDYDGKSLKSFELSEDYYFSREQLVNEFKTRLAIDLYKVFEDIKNNLPVRKYFFIFAFDENMIELSTCDKCGKCDSRMKLYMNFEKKSIGFEFANVQPCVYAKATPSELKIKLDAPSKKLVYLNSPHEFLKIEREDKYKVSINSTLGCIKESEFYEKHNVGFLFVGNTFLYAFKKDNVILFTNYDEYNDEEDNELSSQLEGFEKKGSVCMDLWWYTVLDYDLYISLCSDSGVNPNSINHFVVDIEGTNVEIDHNLTAHKEGHFYGVHSVFKIT